MLQVTTHNLERVRRIKNRMVRLNTRVETIHELLEKLLDDDDDMKDINLTAKQQVGILTPFAAVDPGILVRYVN